MKNHTVYGIVMKSTGLIVYVGMTSQLSKRLSCHRDRTFNKSDYHYNGQLYQLLRKHGLDAFKVVEIDKSSGREVAAKKEIGAIKKFAPVCNVHHNRGVK